MNGVARVRKLSRAAKTFPRGATKRDEKNMLRIRKQRERASGKESASVWTRSGSPSTLGATFAPGARLRGEASSLNGAHGDRRLAVQELSGVFNNRQALI
jgi:hypothetical protein